MAKTLRATHSWGGTTGNDPGVSKFVATLNQAPAVVEVEPNVSYPDSWTYVGRMQVQIVQAAMVGVVQDFPIVRAGNTLLFPRVGIVTAGPPNQTRSYTLLFEPFQWIPQGTIRVFTDPDTAYAGVSNWGGGG